MLSLLITGYALFLVIGMVLFLRPRPKRNTPDFRELLARLNPIRAEGAEFFVFRTEIPRAGTALDFDRLWRVVGGREGLWRMTQNAKVLLLLASLIETQEPGVDLLVKELRADALSLRRQVYRLRILMMLRWTSNWMTSPLNHAGTTYWAMVRRLLELYESHHAPRLGALKVACNVGC